MESFIKPVMIFGCGNTLFGDDGFGPLVADYLRKNFSLPDYMCAADVGTGIQGILFDIALSLEKPSCLFIVDAVSVPDRKAGDLFELDLNRVPEKNAGEFSLHQFPSVNLLRELSTDAGVSVRLLAVQAGNIPEWVQPGLSPEVQAAIEPACHWLLEQASLIFHPEAVKQ